MPPPNQRENWLREGWLEKLSVSAPTPLKNWRRRYIVLGTYDGELEVSWRPDPAASRDASKTLILARGTEVSITPSLELQLVSCGRMLKLRTDASGLLKSWEAAVLEALKALDAPQASSTGVATTPLDGGTVDLLDDLIIKRSSTMQARRPDAAATAPTRRESAVDTLVEKNRERRRTTVGSQGSADTSAANPFGKAEDLPPSNPFGDNAPPPAGNPFGDEAPPPTNPFGDDGGTTNNPFGMVAGGSGDAAGNPFDEPSSTVEAVVERNRTRRQTNAEQ